MALGINAAHPLLLTCMRGAPLTPTGPIDWALLHEQARDHGLLTLLHESLIASGVAVPEFFREAAIAQWASAHLLAAGLESTLDALNGVPVMPLKGPMLAEALYGDPALRPSNDLDLLVRKEDFSHAEALLLNQGFEAEEDTDDYHRVFQRGNLTVELHYDLASPRGLRFDVGEVWSRSTQTEYRFHPVRTMSAEDRAVYLCLHGLKHGFTRLIWIDDVARSIRAVPAKMLFQFAREQNLNLPLAIGCEVVRATIGLSPDITRELERNPRQVESARRGAQMLLAGSVPELDGPEIWSFYLQIETGARQRWRRRLSFFVPTVEDHKWAKAHGVPQSLIPVTRPFRLLKKHGLARAWNLLFPQ